MNLYIQIKDGKPVNHPILQSNLEMIYKNFDPDNPPAGYVKFVRHPRPKVGTYEVIVRNTYEWNGDFVEDNWVVRNMTQTEKENKQKKIKDNWEENGFASWIFNEEKCCFQPPISAPDNTNFYNWDEELYQSDNTKGWVQVTETVEGD